MLVYKVKLSFDVLQSLKSAHYPFLTKRNLKERLAETDKNVNHLCNSNNKRALLACVVSTVIYILLEVAWQTVEWTNEAKNMLPFADEGQLTFQSVKKKQI